MIIEKINAIYARVSTQEQAKEGYSIQHQVKKLRSYFELQGWDNIVIFADEGYSAKDLNRPKLRELINLIQQGKIKRVGTLTVDRMSRNMMDMLNLIEMCEEHETSFICPSINFDTSTPVGRMVLYILSAFAEFQRRMIADNVKSNMDNIVKTRGLYLTSPPFGYTINEATGKLEIVESEAFWIKKVTEQFISGAGYRSIARWLNYNKVKTRRGKMWSGAAVKSLLLNEVYEGKTTWNRRYYDKRGKLRYREEKDWIIRKNTHQPIIEPHQKEKILKRYHEIRENKNKEKKEDNPIKRKGKYTLSGLMYCAYCGAKMTSRKYSSKGPNKNKHIFVCSNYQKKSMCKFNYIFMKEAEKSTINILNQLFEKLPLEYNNLQNLISENLKEIKELTNINYYKNSYTHQKKLLEEKFQRQIKAYENKIITLEELKKAKQRIENEIKNLEIDLKIDYKENHNADSSIYFNIQAKIIRIIFYSIEAKDNEIIKYKLNF